MVWSIVGKMADLGPGTLEEVQIDGGTYAIANVNGALFAIDDICGHAGGHLGSGKLIGATVKCPVHGSVYDLRTGSNL
jgi:nitrite reductase/ring-hydroxylating ferredoxin subunit